MTDDAERLLYAARARGRGALAATWLALMWDVVTAAGQDLARALRSLVRAPGFAVTVALLLGLGVAATTTMERLLDDTLRQDGFAALFVALFAIAGLVTAVTGVYALLAYTVGQRKREIAVRMAIGASSSSVARLIVIESLTLALAGCVLGALGVAGIGRLARSILFGVAPQDPLTLGTTAAVLIAAVLAASWIPARRAARINPVSALRL